jgi:hypothetical protein
MATTRSAKPARQPAAARRVPRAKPSTAKRLKPVSSTKSRTAKSGVKSDKIKPKSTRTRSTTAAAATREREAAVKRPSATRRPVKAQSEKTRAAVAARKTTIGTTTWRVDDKTPIAVDEHDDAAKAALNAQRARATSARRKDEPSPRMKRTAVERVDDPLPATGPLLIERVTRAIERELSLIEVIVGGNHLKSNQRTEAERRARTLASLARTLGEVTRLRTGQHKVKSADDDAVPRDLDEFRRTLSRRLEQLVAGPAAIPAPGHE